MGPIEETKDEQLISCITNGNEDALRTLIDRFNARIKIVLVRRYLGYISRDDLDEILQRTWIRAWRTAERYNPSLSTVWTWLNMLANFEALSFFEETEHISATTLDDLANKAAIQIEQQIQTSKEDTQPSNIVERLLSELPPRQADMIRDYYYRGLTHEGIALKHGLSPNTVKGELSRARTQLKEIAHQLGDTLNDIQNQPVKVIQRTTHKPENIKDE